MDDFSLTPEQKEALFAFQNLLEQWNRAYNLIQHDSLKAFWTRHVLDSAELFASLHAWQKQYPLEPIADLGSGAGLPGVVLSILGIKNLVLIESQHKRSTFLKHVQRSLNLDFHVFPERIEDFTSPCHAFVARALASVVDILSLVSSFPKPQHFWLLKGPKVFEEVKDLPHSHHIVPGKFSKHSFVLEVTIPA